MKNYVAKPSVTLSIALSTRRLILRPYKFSDFKNWSTSRRDQFPSVNEHDPGPSPDKTLTRDFFKKYVDNKKNNVALSPTSLLQTTKFSRIRQAKKLKRLIGSMLKCGVAMQRLLKSI